MLFVVSSYTKLKSYTFVKSFSGSEQKKKRSKSITDRVKINRSTLPTWNLIFSFTVLVNFIFAGERTSTGLSEYCVMNPDGNTHQNSSDQVDSVGKEKEEGATTE